MESIEFRQVENTYPLVTNGGLPISTSLVSSCVFVIGLVVFMPFGTDISLDLSQFLTEEYSNEAIRTDGEIYRKIRQYHFERNLSFKMRWWARLKGNRAQNLKSILRHDDIRAAFDALLDIPGQWIGMRLTTIHKMMALKFDEVPLVVRCYHRHSLTRDRES